MVPAAEHVGLTHVSEEPVSSATVTGCGGVPIETALSSQRREACKLRGDLTVDEISSSSLNICYRNANLSFRAWSSAVCVDSIDRKSENRSLPFGFGNCGSC